MSSMKTRDEASASEVEHRLRMQYPNARVVTTTRRQMLEVPVSGPRIAIEPLSDEQQLAIAYPRLPGQQE